ncbi:MAG TPA: DUF5666 domain-containing protein [Acidimicrobiales bacterium]|nr:DUF5666 domain-containing protein [Acidimicrobiales bacterium]
MYRIPKNQLAKRTGVSALVALGALATGAGIAGAATYSASHGTAQSTIVSPSSRGGHGHGPGSNFADGPGMMRGLGGLVTAVTGTSITVKDPQGTSTTYTIDAATRVTKERQTATAADLVVGEHVRILASPSSATTAAGIDIELARIGGQVVSVSASTITVADRDGFYRTVSVNGTTTYSKGGTSANLSDVTTGTFILAEGTVDANHTTLDASAVGIGLPSPTGTSNAAGPMGTGVRGMPGGFGDMNGGMH